MFPFDMVADSLLYCYLPDEKESTGRSYAPATLSYLIKEHGAKQAARRPGPQG